MKVDGKHYTSIWFDESSQTVRFIDQTLLPHEFQIGEMKNLSETCEAIVTMRLRGAPLIGAAAAFGLAFALLDDPSNASFDRAAEQLVATRPTAVNIFWAVERVRGEIGNRPQDQRGAQALLCAQRLLEEDIRVCSQIGDHGVPTLQRLWQARSNSSDRLNILTHCNAGWLATVDWGTALSPVYKGHELDLPVHVWVDETRPRTQGSSLTAWELGKQGIAHTILTDTMAGHLMSTGRVDVCIVGSDRTTARGDVFNKIGTYMVALAAKDNGIPFYVAVPSSSIDWATTDPGDIQIEERDPEEVTHRRGVSADGEAMRVRVTPKNSPVVNYGFDLTPARLVTALITEHGVFPATQTGLADLSKQREAQASRSA